VWAIAARRGKPPERFCILTLAGLVPAIHVFPSAMPSLPATIVVGSKVVDARHKAEHDDL
jgi:hypothetical protein